MGKRIDLRSDTVTQPTEQMRLLMAKAEVGDDVYGEDPTVRRLEELAADIFGKEAALFVTSGTQGNQVAIAAWAERGDEVIVEAESHVFYYEVAGISVIAGAQARPIAGRMGAMDPEEVRRAIRPRDIHQPRTGLICVENTHNRAGGTVLPIEILQATASVAREAGCRCIWMVRVSGTRLSRPELMNERGPATSIRCSSVCPKGWAHLLGRLWSVRGA
ncbi:hypothetical protein GCM10025858_11890 [Alicyclobacillus sacchari]|nr:hypothetical protein GCM10025858_11890 [Alicyclobacillus sacchari]